MALRRAEIYIGSLSHLLSIHRPMIAYLSGVAFDESSVDRVGESEICQISRVSVFLNFVGCNLGCFVERGGVVDLHNDGFVCDLWYTNIRLVQESLAVVTNSRDDLVVDDVDL